jgi:uncharacterized protein (DUF486 family)
MIKIIFGGIFAIACGVAANLLTPDIRKLLKSDIPESPPTSDRKKREMADSNDDIEKRRERNRKKLNEIITLCVFNGFSFYVLFGAIYLPIHFKKMGSDIFELSTTRLPIDISISSDHLITICLGFALLLYIPCYLISVKIASFAKRLVLNIQEVSSLRLRGFVTLSMFLLAFLICGHLIFILNPEDTYLSSVSFPFLALLIFGGFISRR